MPLNGSLKIESSAHRDKMDICIITFRPGMCRKSGPRLTGSLHSSCPNSTWIDLIKCWSKTLKNLLAPWWTLWCEGRLKTRPRAPKSPTFGLRMRSRVGWSLSPARCGSKIGRESSAQSAPEFLCCTQFAKQSSNSIWMIILIWHLSKKLTSIIGVGMARASGR